MNEITYEEWLKEIKRCRSHRKVYSLIRSVPGKFKTEELCLAAIKNDKEDKFTLLHFVPEELKTYELCLAAIEKNSNGIDCVPEAFKTQELYIAYLKQCKRSKRPYLFSVPDELWKDAGFCLEAVKANFWAINNVPEDMRTSEICLIVTDKMPKHMGADSLLLDIPKELWQDASFCNEAASNHGSALKYVPENFRTVELCAKAILSTYKWITGANENDEYIFKHYVPDELKAKVEAKLGWGWDQEKYNATIQKTLSYEKEAKSSIEDENYLKAIDFYSQAIECCPFPATNKVNNHRFITVLLHKRANLYERQEEYQKAINDCKEALALQLGREYDSEKIKETLERCVAALMTNGDLKRGVR